MKKGHLLRTNHRGKLQCIKRQICSKYKDRRDLSLYAAIYWLLSDALFSDTNYS